MNAPIHGSDLAAPGMVPEIVQLAIPADERVWVPQAPGVFFRPLMLKTVTGQWWNLLKVTRTGVVSRHRHPSMYAAWCSRAAGATSSTTGWRKRMALSTSRPAGSTPWWWRSR